MLGVQLLRNSNSGCPTRFTRLTTHFKIPVISNTAHLDSSIVRATHVKTQSKSYTDISHKRGKQCLTRAAFLTTNRNSSDEVDKLHQLKQSCKITTSKTTTKIEENAVLC